jgi:lysozyme
MSRNLKAGIDLIKEFEGCYLKTYKDPRPNNPIWTIGWGTIRYPDGKPVREGDVISQALADLYLMAEVDKLENDVESLVKVPVSDEQFSALLSFAYNVGADIDADTIAEGLGDSTLLKKLNAGDYAGAAAEFPKWNKAEGKVLNGLVRRRAAERKLFESTQPSSTIPIEQESPAPEAPSWFEVLKNWFLLVIEKLFGGKGHAGVTPELPTEDLAAKIHRINPFIEKRAILEALKWREHKKIKNSAFITIVDMNKPDYEHRFYLITMSDLSCISTWAAHGTNSDKNKDGVADSFSNVSGSLQTSLGAAVFGENYESKKKKDNSFRISRRIDGLESTNSNMRARGCVLHDSFYVTPKRAEERNIGDSEGCVVLYYPVLKEINPLLEGSLLFIWDDSYKA